MTKFILITLSVSMILILGWFSYRKSFQKSQTVVKTNQISFGGKKFPYFFESKVNDDEREFIINDIKNIIFSYGDVGFEIFERIDQVSVNGKDFQSDRFVQPKNSKYAPDIFLDNFGLLVNMNGKESLLIKAPLIAEYGKRMAYIEQYTEAFSELPNFISRINKASEGSQPLVTPPTELIYFPKGESKTQKEHMLSSLGEVKLIWVSILDIKENDGLDEIDEQINLIALLYMGDASDKDANFEHYPFVFVDKKWVQVQFFSNQAAFFW